MSKEILTEALKDAIIKAQNDIKQYKKENPHQLDEDMKFKKEQGLFWFEGSEDCIPPEERYTQVIEGYQKKINEYLDELYNVDNAGYEYDSMAGWVSAQRPDLRSGITVEQYAYKYDVSPSTIRHRIARGAMQATKIGHDWVINKDEPYIDGRETSGKYKNWRKKEAE